MDSIIRRMMRNLPQDGRIPPSQMLDVPDIPTVSIGRRCHACQIPRHGFLCSFSDGTCLKYNTPETKEKEDSK